MNYKEINNSILAKNDLPDDFVKDDALYNYLLKNNVAYYYSKTVSNAKTDIEKEIIEKGEKLNEKFYKTLKLIDDVCIQNGIDYALFKTFKHVEEAVDGDIDCVVREKDFQIFLKMLNDRGFECEEEAPLKGCCIKEGYLKIEPRSNISHHGMILIEEDVIWNNVEEVYIQDLSVKTTSRAFDGLCLLFNCLYGPKYLSLYLRLLVNEYSLSDFGNIIGSEKLKKDLKFIFKQLIDSKNKNKHPVFFKDIPMLLWWLKRLVPNISFTFLNKIRHLTFFFYSKYKYVFFGKLHFEHDWGNSP